MAKRDSGTKKTNAPGATAASATEQRVLAFAEQLGRIAGSFQAKAEGWLDRDALNAQIASVRDDAAALLEQLADGATKATKVFEASKAAQASRTAKTKPAPAAPRGASKAPGKNAGKGRSGGTVDAPGKKHRTRAPGDPDARVADSQAAKVRAARPMAKTSKLRGRG